MNQIREESKEIQEPFQQSPPLINSYNQNTRPRRQRLQRNGQIWPGSEEVIGDGCPVSIRTETKKKLKDIRRNNPYPGSRVKDKAKEIVDDNKETVADSISEGFEVIGDEEPSRPYFEPPLSLTPIISNPLFLGTKSPHMLIVAPSHPLLKPSVSLLLCIVQSALEKPSCNR
ncbi:hypothetical protein WN944_006284 [Citrus x changshan-huyou]|uniref:Uncharacterized protein n=1 Tax=Citrus x changshan-huyou TaxID=2935761 RepID=A0AAP0MIW2_9ROSI